MFAFIRIISPNQQTVMEAIKRKINAPGTSHCSRAFGWLTTKPSRAISRCSSAKVFGGSGMPSGVCTLARRSAAVRRVGLKLRMPSRARVDFIRFTIRVRSPTRQSRSRFWPLGVLFGNRGHARHAAMARFSTQPPQEPALQQLGVEPVGFRSAMLPRYREARGMDYVSLDATRLKPARQPEAVAAGFEGQRNPRDCAPGPDRLILPALQQAKQSFWARLELLARLSLNPGKHAGDEPARLAQLDDGNDRADSGPGRRGICSGRSAGASRHSIG